MTCIHQTVTFTPTSTGAQSAVYSITGDDGQGAIAVQLTGTGVTGTGTTNIAAGRPATASSTVQNYGAGNVTDADASSYWESANNAFPQWIQVDLGASTSVGKVTLKLPPATAWQARTQTLSVQAGTDGTTFATVVPATGYAFDPATGNTVTITFPATNARYLRAAVTANTGWPAGQLSDFEVFATGGGGGSATLTTNPGSLTFGATPVNTNDEDWQTVTVTNTGTATATLSAITASGDFTLASTCGATLAAGANCTVTVTFHPTAAGSRTGTLTIAGNATNSPSTVALTGTGTSTASASLSANPASLTFAATTVGAASPVSAVTVSNTGAAAAAVTSITAAGDYTQTNTCGAAIAAGASCTVSVVFHPSATGTRTGALSVISSATNSPLSVALSGSGSTTTPVNLALNKVTTESTHTQTYASGNAIDGSANSYWESVNSAFPQWLQVDLGSVQTVSRVVVKLPPSADWATRSQTIAVSGSTNGTTFSTLAGALSYTFNPATGNTVTITFPATAVRYLRITITANTGWPAGQVAELEVYAS